MVCLTSAPMQVYPATRGLSLAWLLHLTRPQSSPLEKGEKRETSQLLCGVYEVVRVRNLAG